MFRRSRLGIWKSGVFDFQSVRGLGNVLRSSGILCSPGLSETFVAFVLAPLRNFETQLNARGVSGNLD